MGTLTRPTIWSTDRVRMAARDSFQLELDMGASASEAALAMVETVIESQSLEMLRNIRDWLLTEAEDLDDELQDDGAISLCWFARMLDDEIPMESRE